MQTTIGSVSTRKPPLLETIKEKYSTVQYGTVQFSYEYTLRNQRYIHRVRYSYTLRKVRQASGQVRSQQAVGSWAGLVLGRWIQGLETTDFSRISR